MLPHPRIHLQSLISVLDFAGIAVGSIGGALHAREHVRYEYDIIGAFGLALCSALGGGIVRDVLLGVGPPLALVDVGYLYTALGAAACTLLLGARIGKRTQRVLLYVDAAAVSLFAVAGTARAEAFGVQWLPALMLGVTTAVGGGSLRDVLSGTTPKVFERGNYYAIAAAAAAGSYLLLDWLDLPDAWCVSAAALIGFTLRILSMLLNWRTGALRETESSVQ
ncbi:trimeric intracellular cation channel family protein [Acidipila sp. EB88]|uniref:trimeric intracellular cation channel family protein n=1 Tax=Acidipila sp. EB88 TaxID=2305226 RepID=UPI00131512ED|nr:TRIC cation channel family protein [Acidipila sp. EB88]